ncbi:MULTISPECIES: MMPL family transporter [unclassified Streptomyces]|uniref:MMPL family transporter n=1 Tax=unclassified Streptomyces TaxID=2593676 RepID=UPI000DC7D3AE|nr:MULTISPECIES: MMPL family transporter [unclassified Streptomyces]AWZ03719.1 MMPL family transporter [Streptomyces sp. ICC4]AWZ11797.1 MMPL family transporter [Streptomyces sp. ICC1]
MSEVKKPPSPVEGGRWTRFVTARPRLSLLLALVVTALAVFAGGGVADRLGSGGWEDPGARSTYATEALEREFPGSQSNLLLLVDAGAEVGPAGVDDPAVVAEAQRLATELAAEQGVIGVGSYWQTRLPALRSTDGRQALVVARVPGDDKAVNAVLDRIAPHYRGEHGPVKVSLGGPAAVQREVTTTIQEDLLRAELIALPVTLVLLVLVFGSAIAALLPLGVGIVAIIGTNAVLRGLTELTDVSVFAQNLTTALGLGLAVDYALFIVRRFREELAAGRDPVAAVGVTLRTAGRTVLFSALTVAVSLSAMLFFPMYFLRSFAYAGVAVVLLAAAAALILLPAALVLLGDRVNSLDLRRLWQRGRPARGPASPAEGGRGWARLTALVMRRAPLFAVATTAGLLLLGLPFLGVKFGTVDDRQLPKTAESHVVQQQIREGFAGAPGGALTVLAEGASGPALDGYMREVGALPGVVRVDGPVSSPSGGAYAYFSVLTEGEAVGQEAQDLVGQVRKVEAPFETAVTGQAAVLVDARKAIADELPLALALVVAATLLLVFLLTGSLLIPLQAVLLNALSLTAMFGAVVWVFQEGHLSGPLAFTSTGDIETTLPVLMFCIAFGLSMDYGVFLISRIKEEYDRTGDHEGSVRAGLARTGGLITAAAVILAVVMVAIGSSRVTNTKMLGLGIALAVLMDAMVVRSLLVPAVMKLTGKATWWAPAPLRRAHERFGLSEGEPAVRAPEAEEPERIPAASH